MFVENVWNRKSCYDCCFLTYEMDSFWCGGGRDLGWSVVIPAWCPDKKRHITTKSSRPETSAAD